MNNVDRMYLFLPLPGACPHLQGVNLFGQPTIRPPFPPNQVTLLTVKDIPPTPSGKERPHIGWPLLTLACSFAWLSPSEAMILIYSNDFVIPQNVCR